MVGKIPANRLYQVGLNILKMYPLPNCPEQCASYPASAPYNYELTTPVISYLNNQPAIRLDYQPKQSLRMTVKYAGEKQRKQTFPGSLPGFNDTRMHDPVVTTIAIPVNYNLNASTFFEVNYGYAQRRGRLRQHLQHCTSSIPMSPARQAASPGDLPLLFPDGINMIRGITVRAAHEDQHADVPERHDLLPPTFAWGNRVAMRRRTTATRAFSTTT